VRQYFKRVACGLQDVIITVPLPKVPNRKSFCHTGQWKIWATKRLRCYRLVFGVSLHFNRGCIFYLFILYVLLWFRLSLCNEVNQSLTCRSSWTCASYYIARLLTAYKSHAVYFSDDSEISLREINGIGEDLSGWMANASLLSNLRRKVKTQ